MIFVPEKSTTIFFLSNEKHHHSSPVLKIITRFKKGIQPKIYEIKPYQNPDLGGRFDINMLKTILGKRERQKLGVLMGLGEDYYLQENPNPLQKLNVDHRRAKNSTTWGPSDQEHYERERKSMFDLIHVNAIALPKISLEAKISVIYSYVIGKK